MTDAVAAAAAAKDEEDAASRGFRSRLESLDTGIMPSNGTVRLSDAASLAAKAEEESATADFKQRLANLKTTGEVASADQASEVLRNDDGESDTGSSYTGSESPSVPEGRGRSRSPRGAARAGPSPCKLALGMVVELSGLAKALELNGRRGVITAGPDVGGRWETLLFPSADAPQEKEPRRLSVTKERFLVPPEFAVAGSVRMRFRNIPAEYDTALLKEELGDECFVEGEQYSGLLFDKERRFGYLTVVSERVAMQLIGEFDGRRLERAGPGRSMTESVLAQIVKLELL